VQLDKYFEYIKEYYDIKLILKGSNHINKTVFVATDELFVFTELRYPGYKWMRLGGGAETSQLNNRYSDDGQDAITNDLFVLAQADFVVCTFSSNICRITGIDEPLQTATNLRNKKKGHFVRSMLKRIFMSSNVYTLSNNCIIIVNQ
jgi:hypothetical protein